MNNMGRIVNVKGNPENDERADMFKTVKSVGWDIISLSKRGYRGAIKAYKNAKGEKIPIMFYLDECFIIEDSLGLFRVEDLKSFFMKEHREIDMTATGCIQGLSLIAYLDDERQSHFMDSVLTRLGINTISVREDIRNRLLVVNQLAEEVDVDMGYGKVE